MDSTSTGNYKVQSFGGLEGFLDDVDRRLKDFGQTVEGAAGEVKLKAHLGLMEAEELWTKGKTELLKVVSRLQEVQARPKAALEEGRIELFFGKEDAKEAMTRLRKRLEETEQLLSVLGAETSADATAALQRLRDAYAAVRERLLH